MSKPTRHTVAVLGTGLMGAAITRVLVDHGHEVHVWNRTPERAAPLAERGARLAATVTAAIEPADLVIVVVGTIPQIHHHLGGLDLTGKDVVSVVSGGPAAVEELDQALREQGAAFLDGAIQAYPDDMGKATTKTFYSGDRALWNRHQDLLLQLGGTSTFVGETPGAAKTMNSAWVSSFLCTALAGFHEAMAFAESRSVSVDAMDDAIDYAVDMLRLTMRASVTAIRDNKFTSDQAQLIAFLEGVKGAHDAMITAGLPADYVTTTKNTLERAVDQGHATDGIAAQYLVMRAADSPSQR